MYPSCPNSKCNDGRLGWLPAIPGVVPIIGGVLPKLPIIGGIFAKGECPPTLPGMVSSRCRNPDQHFFMVGSDKWHTTDLPDPAPQLMHLVPNGEWGGFQKASGWLPYNSPRVPQEVRDTLQYILTGGTEAPAPNGRYVPTEVAGAGPALGAAVPLLIGGGLLLAMFAGKK